MRSLDSDPAKNFSSPQFLKKLKERDHLSVTQIVQAYTEQLYRTALGLGFAQDAAREVTQSVWTTFFEVVSKFEGRSHIRTFIFGILYNKASELKRDHRRFDSPDPIEEILDQRFDVTGHWIKPPIDPEKFLMGTESGALIEKCLEGLPLNQRMAFFMKEVEERKSSEVCKILAVSGTNLGVLLYRARNRLRECIEGKVARQGA